jgi:hypothetical protein
LEATSREARYGYPVVDGVPLMIRGEMVGDAGAGAAVAGAAARIVLMTAPARRLTVRVLPTLINDVSFDIVGREPTCPVTKDISASSCFVGYGKLYRI